MNNFNAQQQSEEEKLIVVLVFICLFAHSNHSTFPSLSRSFHLVWHKRSLLRFASDAGAVAAAGFLSYHFNSRASEFSTVFIDLIQFQREHIIHIERNFIEAINQHQLKCVAGVSDNKSSIA